jgi:transcriptional regulator with XRE-family HTH domain
VVASELVTNAIQVTTGRQIPVPIRLWLLGDNGRVCIAVWDADPRLPQPNPVPGNVPDRSSEGGRGLFLVASFSDRWGWYATPKWGGKVVWAEVVDLPPSNAHQRGKPAMPRPLSAQHALVGAMLRQYREKLGYSLDDVARILECDRSKISRIETGQRGIRPLDIRALLTEYGVDVATQQVLVLLARSRRVDGWPPPDHRKILGDDYLDFTRAEVDATHVKIYAPLQIPDLLHTEAYAAAVAAADPAIPEDGEHLAVGFAMIRQATVLSQRHTECIVILGEAALKQPVGGTAVLREQLTHLVNLAASCPRLTIRILPFSTGAHAAGNGGGFSVLQFHGTPDIRLVHLTGPRGGICLDDAAAISSYANVFAQLGLFALSPEQSAEKLRRLAGHQCPSTFIHEPT